MAELLNKSMDAETFLNRSKNYKNVWNKKRELMCPRSKNGNFNCPLDPTLNTWIVKDDGFTEGEHGGLLCKVSSLIIKLTTLNTILTVYVCFSHRKS